MISYGCTPSDAAETVWMFALKATQYGVVIARVLLRALRARIGRRWSFPGDSVGVLRSRES